MRIMKTTCIQLSNMMIAIDVRRELEGRSLLTTKIREKKQERFIPLILTLNVVATPSQLGFFLSIMKAPKPASTASLSFSSPCCLRPQMSSPNFETSRAAEFIFR